MKKIKEIFLKENDIPKKCSDCPFSFFQGGTKILCLPQNSLLFKNEKNKRCPIKSVKEILNENNNRP